MNAETIYRVPQNDSVAETSGWAAEVVAAKKNPFAFEGDGANAGVVPENAGLGESFPRRIAAVFVGGNPFLYERDVMFNRREFVKASVVATLGAAVAGEISASDRSVRADETTKSVAPRRIVLHQTDLYHPHGDPDDHFDLATVFGWALLGAIDLRGLILDYPPQFRLGDPAVAAVAQMNRLTGRTTPIALGSRTQIEKRGDLAPNLSPSDSVAVNFMIETLEKAEAPVHLSVVGSATDVAIASSRRPELFREKCAGVYLNSGGAWPNAEKPDALEFNVNLNPIAYATLFDLPCPLFWFPCWHNVETRVSGENGTFYWLEHRRAFEGIAESLAGYFAYMFERSTDPHWLKAIESKPNEESWAKILADKRGMWSTASLFYLAGKTILKNGEIVDRSADVDASDDVLFRMENVDVSCDDAGRTTWKFVENETNRKMFRVLDVAAYPDAAATAINTLFRAFR